LLVEERTVTEIVRVVPELAHRPPALTAPTVISLAPSQACPALDPARDYIVKLPLTAPYSRQLFLSGGRHVVVVGGEINLTAVTNRAVYTKDLRGTLYVEGVKITGPGVQDAFVIDSRYGGAVVLQNVAVLGAFGSEAGYHADLVQTWAGPARLLVDHFFGKSAYQGFFLHPGQQWSGWTGTDVD
jgi:hypothetical protein